MASPWSVFRAATAPIRWPPRSSRSAASSSGIAEALSASIAGEWLQSGIIVMTPNIPVILQAVLEDYAPPGYGHHRVAHWARVLENGGRLAEQTGADLEVVQLFAVLHDSRRVNEGSDPEHGPRAAEFARALRGRLFDLPDRQFALLYR